MTKRQLIYTLAAVNVGLLGTLAWRAIPSNVAHAQEAGGGPRQRGEYVFTTADVPGGSVGVVVVIDQVNREMTALASDRGSITSQVPIKLDQVFEGGQVAQPRGNGRGTGRNTPPPRTGTR
jgi:hypothetical protein